MVHETTYSGPDASGAPTRDPFFESLAGAGEMGPRMLEMDWARTALGPIAQWPHSLKTAAALVLNSPVPIVMLWGPDGIMIYNDAYSVFAGGRHPHLLGSPVLAGWPEVADFNRRVMEVGLSGGTLSFRDEHLVLHRNGVPEHVWLNLDYSPIRDETGKPAGVLAIVVETTQRVVAERQVRELNEKLKVQVDALAELDRSKTSFFSNVSHEFRTPLALILGPLEEVLPEARERLSPERHEQLVAVRRYALRLLKLVNTLLDFSRIEAGRVHAVYQPTDLATLTSEIASVFHSAMDNAGLRFSVECQPIGEPVYVDRDMLEKIVLNLLSNAFKFTFEGEVAVTLTPVDGAVELQVRDTGVGIPDNQRERVFERFHRIEGTRARTYEGTGIGLALVHELVKLHGGSVRVESTLGQGSTFTVTIPRGKAHLPAERIQAAQSFASSEVRAEAFADEAQRWLPQKPDDAVDIAMLPKPASLAPSAEPELAARRELIVLADDNADMRQYLRHLLSDRYDVHAVADGRQALEATRRLRPALVLADVMMPQLDGFSLLRAIRDDSALASTPVILLSARAGEESRVEGLQADADDYLVKPFAARELLARVVAHVKMANLRRETAEREERLRNEAEIERQKLHASQELLAETSRFYRELQNREAKIRRLVDANIVGIFIWNLEGQILEANDAFLRMVGYDRDDLVSGRVRWTDLTPAEWRERDEQAIADLGRTGTVQPYEKEYFRKDGIRIPVLLGGAMFEGNRNEGVAFVLDLSEQKRAQEALRRSEAYLAEAQRLSQTGSWAWSPDTDVRYWSEECYRVLGFDPRDGLPRIEQLIQRIHPDDQPAFRESVKRAKHEKLDEEADYRIVQPGGAVRDVHSIGHPVFSPSGELIEFTGTVIDVTERKRAEEELRRSEMELRQMLDLTPQYLFVLKADGSPFYANRASLDYLGMSLDGWRQRRSIGEEVHPDDVERLIAESNRASSTGSAYEVEVRVRKGDGSFRWVLSRFNPLHDDKGQVMRWYVASTDIDERKRAEERLLNENVALREEIDKASMFEEIVGTSPALKAALSRISKVAPSDTTVLITGETGTGKELVARAIHRRSSRASRAFVSVNCAAIPRDLIASELFGHEKGAFTGATQQRLGRFELANGGTIFLDEVGELPAETQIALLRVLQEHEFERVGGTRPIRADVRVIAATNRDLQAAISAGSFRSDLFYRLHVFPIEIPPLRERDEDIPLLVEYFIDRFARKAGKNIRGVDKKTLQLLQSYPWPGNIRELQNVIERSVIVCETDNFSVDESWLSQQPRDRRPAGDDLSAKVAAQEKEIIEKALRESQGRVFGPSGAAAKLGIPRSTLESKIRSLKIEKKRFKA